MVEHRSTQGANHQQAPSRLQQTVFLSGLGLLSSITLLTAFAEQAGWAQTPMPEATPALPVAATASDAPLPAAAPIPPESFPIEFSTPSTAPASQPQPQPPIATPAVPPKPTADNYIAPGTIIFSERSTGCQATVRSGQTPDSICGRTAGVRQVNVPGWQGANGRPASGVTAIGVRSVTAIAPSVNIGTTPSLKDFYRRTLRPPAKLGNGNVRLIFPLSIPAPISSLFGWRIHPITGDPRFHSGTDLAAPLGTPVLAAYAGQVVLADFLGGYGLTVAVNHMQDTQQTLYAHLSEVFVQAGDTVKQGDVIGRVGSTGNSTGPHLHFEFRQLTAEGWVALDAGAQLEYALAQLVNSLQIAQASSPPIRANAGVQGVIQ